MGITQSLSDVYHRVEDKWYKALDWLDGRGVPVYALVDKIDAVVPSFILFLALLLLVVLFLAGGLFGGFFPFGAPTTLVVSVIDVDGNPLEGANVGITLNNDLKEFVTNGSGETIAVEIGANSTAEIRVRKEGFEENTQSLTVESGAYRREVVLEALTSQFHQLLFKGKNNQSIKSPLSVSFSCTNTGVSPPAGGTTITGVFTVQAPAGCGGLLASVSSEFFETVSSILVSESQQIVSLTEKTGSQLAQAQGNISVELRRGTSLLSEPVEVELYRLDEDGLLLGPIETKTSSNGRAVFSNIAIGDYVVKNVATSTLASVASAPFVVEKNVTAPALLSLEVPVVGVVRLRVVNGANQRGIENALVTLRGAGGDSAKSTDSNGFVEFPVGSDVAFQAFVDHPDYCFKSQSNLRISENAAIISLVSVNNTCNGELRVKVVDQDNKPVSGALAGLFTEEGYATGAAKKVTDVNGTAIFSRLPSGSYVAFAYKGFFVAKSTVVNFDGRGGREPVEALVVLVIENGILEVELKGEDERPLQFAEVRFFNADNDQLISGGALPVEDRNGTLSFPVRADKRVYFTVEYPDYPRFVSKPYDVFPGSVTKARAILSREKNVKGSVTLEPIGIFRNDERVTVVAGGESYAARFLLSIPREKSYDRVGVHVRSGNGPTILEREKIVLHRLSAGLAHSTVQSTSFSPPKGTSKDLANVTEDDSLWINAEWMNPGSGTFEIEVEFKAKDNVLVDDALVLSYRAWGVKNNVFERDPVDQSLQSSESLPELHALYANARVISLQAGAETVCDGQFCFSASLLDVTENIVMNTTENFTADIFKPYRLNVTILNAASDTSVPFTGADMRLDNEDRSLDLNAFSFSGAQGQNPSGVVEVSSDSTPWVPVGDWRPGTSIGATLSFVPQKTGTSVIRIRVRSNQRIVFEKELFIEVRAAKRFSVLTEPALLVAGIEQDLKVTVTEEGTSKPVENAFVRLKDEFGFVLFETRSSRLGLAVLRVPAFAPGTRLRVNVEKSEFEVFEKEIDVSGDILSFDPERLGFGLNVKSKTEDSAPLKISNKTGFDVRIVGLRLVDDRSGLLDAARIDSALSALELREIKAQDYATFNVFVALSSAGKRLIEPREISTMLQVTAEIASAEYSFEIPVVVSIGIGGETDNPTCFSVTKRKWTDFTEGKPVQFEFDLRNNCSVEGKPVALSNLEVMLEPAGNEVGSYLLRGPNSELVVRSGYFSRVANDLAAQSDTHFVLVFTPDAGINGQSKATITFRASNFTDREGDESGVQHLSDVVTTDITINNLLDCVLVNPDLLTIERDGEGAFTVETQSCGEKTRIILKSRLPVSPAVFDLESSAKKEVKVPVERNMPGQYPVYVYAKADGSTEEKLVKLVRVKIPATGCIELARYEFDIFDDPRNPFDGYDTTELYNNCFNKPVTANVRYNEHDWDGAIHDGIGLGILMGFLSGVNSSGAGCDFLTGNCDPNDPGLFGIGSGNANKQDAKPVVGEQPADCVEITTPTGAPAGNKYCNSNDKIYQRRSDGKWVKWIEPETTSEEKPAEDNKSKTADVVSRLPANVLLATSAPGLNFSTGFVALVAQFQSAQPASNPVQYPAYNSSPQGAVSAPVASSGARPSNGYAPAGNSGGMGNMLGSLFGGKGFLSGALMGTMAGTYMAYSEQDEGEFNLNMIQRDVAIRKLELLLPGKLDEAAGNKADSKGSTEINMQAPVNTQGFSYQSKEEKSNKGIFGTLLGGEDDEKDRLSNFSCPPARQGGPDATSQGGLFGGQVIGVGVNAPVALRLGDFLKGFSNAPKEGPASKEITILDLKQSSLEPREDNPALSREVRRIRFNNEGKLVQKDPAIPFYRVLAVTADQYEYLKEYEFFKAEDAKQAFARNNGNLCVSSIAPVFQAMQLQFNSYRPTNACEINPNGPGCPPVEIPNCQLGTKTGLTGANNVPKIKLDWAFSRINKDTCLAESPTGVYCDATQFTIALVSRLHEIEGILNAKAPSTCPTEATRSSEKKQALHVTNADIGITQLTARHDDRNVEISFVAESSNSGKSMTAQVQIKALNLVTNESIDVCTKQITLSSRSVESCDWRPDFDARFEVTASLNAALCAECLDSEAKNNSIAVGVTTSKDEGLLQCEDKRLARLPAFLEASGASAGEIATATSLIRFDALLMRDGYTNDFFADFDDYCTSKSFFDCPNWYRDPAASWSRILSNPAHIRFDYPGAPGGFVDAGRYEVSIDAVFDKNDWKFFNEGEVTADIVVRLVKKDTPNPDNPLYYLPFDGTVGLDTENGRQGYGVNFAQESLEAVKINRGDTQVVSTVHSPSSNNTHIGVVHAKLEKDFRRINVDEDSRGVVLQLSRLDDETSLVLSPSYATPVLMHIERSASENAFGYYSVEVDSTPQVEFDHLAEWQPINTACRDFEDALLSDMLGTGQNDVHGISTTCANIGPNALSAYGLEWCNVSRSGKIGVQTVLFTPQSSTAIMKRVAASDRMTLVGPGNRGDQVGLTGVPGQSYNMLGGRDISTLADILELMGEGRVCMQSGNSVNATFFWNPKPVLDALASERNTLVQGCIGELVGEQGDIQGTGGRRVVARP